MLENTLDNQNSEIRTDKGTKSKYSLVAEITFDAAHRLSNYAGKCKKIHGHTYLVKVKVSSNNLLHWGAAMDFGDLKKVMKDHIDKKYDHKLLLKVGDPLNEAIEKSLEEVDTEKEWIVWMNENTTAENIAHDIYKDLEAVLKAVAKNIKLEEIIVFETPTNSAIYSEYVN